MQDAMGHERAFKTLDTILAVQFADCANPIHGGRRRFPLAQAAHGSLLKLPWLSSKCRINC
jgi:hypothetical protein